MDVSDRVSALLTEAKQPKLLDALQKAGSSGVSTEITELPDCETRTDRFIITVPTNIVRRTSLEAGSASPSHAASHSPLQMVRNNATKILGMQRMSQMLPTRGTQDSLTIALPINAKQLHDILAIHDPDTEASLIKSFTPLPGQQQTRDAWPHFSGGRYTGDDSPSR